MRALRPCTSPADGPARRVWFDDMVVDADDLWEVLERHRHVVTIPDTPSGPESAASHPAGMSAQYRHLRRCRTFAMSETPEAYDAIIIGAGVIGAAIAHELAGRGWKTLTVDKAASAGPVRHQLVCIVRFSYSSVEGTNLAWEGMHYWKDWPAYIGTDDELGLIDYHMTGQLVFQPPGEGTTPLGSRPCGTRWTSRTRRGMPTRSRNDSRTSIQASSVRRPVLTTTPSGRTHRARSSAAISPQTLGM